MAFKDEIRSLSIDENMPDRITHFKSGIKVVRLVGSELIHMSIDKIWETNITSPCEQNRNKTNAKHLDYIYIYSLIQLNTCSSSLFSTIFR